MSREKRVQGAERAVKCSSYMQMSQWKLTRTCAPLEICKPPPPLPAALLHTGPPSHNTQDLQPNLSTNSGRKKNKLTPVRTYRASGFVAFAVLRVIAICKPMRQLPTRRPAKPRGGQRISITMTTHDHSSPLSPPQEPHTGAAPTQSPDFK